MQRYQRRPWSYQTLWAGSEAPSRWGEAASPNPFSQPSEAEEFNRLCEIQLGHEYHSYQLGSYSRHPSGRIFGDDLPPARLQHRHNSSIVSRIVALSALTVLVLAEIDKKSRSVASTTLRTLDRAREESNACQLWISNNSMLETGTIVIFCVLVICALVLQMMQPFATGPRPVYVLVHDCRLWSA